MTDNILDTWMSVAEAFPLLRKHFRTLKTFQHHLWKRDENGLAAAGAVRMTPFKRLLVNPERVRAWAMAEDTQAAA